MLESELVFGNSTPNKKPGFLLTSIFNDVKDETGFLPWGLDVTEEDGGANGVVMFGWVEEQPDGTMVKRGIRLLGMVDEGSVSVMVQGAGEPVESEGPVLSVPRNLGGYQKFLRNLVDLMRKKVGQKGTGESTGFGEAKEKTAEEVGKVVLKMLEKAGAEKGEFSASRWALGIKARFLWPDDMDQMKIDAAVEKAKRSFGGWKVIVKPQNPTVPKGWWVVAVRSK